MNKKIDKQKLLKPAEYVEHHLVEAILNGTFQCGSNLPNERILAVEIGVTRPTLRETLQRLARDGWITIQHGKATRINDYWKEGGLGILNSIVNHSKSLSNNLVLDLLEVRSALMPGVARIAVDRGKKELTAYLARAESLGDDAKIIAEYDWGLQILMVDLTGNSFFRLILNDFTSMYQVLAERYFKDANVSTFSKAYYEKLLKAVQEGSERVEQVVRETMEHVIELWKEVQ